MHFKKKFRFFLNFIPVKYDPNFDFFFFKSKAKLKKCTGIIHFLEVELHMDI